MNYTWAGYTSKGGRKKNEDTFFVGRHGAYVQAIVADGLGMHGLGDEASRMAVKAISESMNTYTQWHPQCIFESFNKANEAVLSIQTPICKMKSTAVALFLCGDKRIIAHVGDSRCYCFTGNKLVYQTSDHSVSQMAVKLGEIRPEQIRFHEDRSKVLRCLGGDLMVKPDISEPLTVRSGDSFLLCSDGFWELVLEHEMEEDLCCSKTPNQWLSRMKKRVDQKIGTEGDNHTAIAIFSKM